MYGNHGNGMHMEQRRDHYHYQNPHETATQGSGSGGSNGTEPWSNSTDPSSEASSVERFQQQQQQLTHQPPKPDLGEQYGFNGFGEAPNGLEYINNEPAVYGMAGNGLDRRPQMRQSEIPPPPPPHLSNSAPRQPIKANTLRKQMHPIHEGVQSPVKRTNTGEKRKSWLMRRFSRGS